MPTAIADRKLSKSCPIVLLLPHPDDEVFCIEYLCTQPGRQKILYFLTKDSSNLRRVQESHNFLSRMGCELFDKVEVGSLLNVPDGSLLDRVLDLRQWILADIQRRQIDELEVVFPAGEGGHQDHDAAFVLGLQIETWAQQHLCEGGSGSVFSMYNGLGTLGKLFLCGQSIERKPIWVRQTNFSKELKKFYFVFQSYPTQFKTWIILMPMYLLSLVLGRKFDLYKPEPIFEWEVTQETPLFVRHRRVPKGYIEKITRILSDSFPDDPKRVQT